MIARFAGAGLGLLAFAITTVAGLWVQNPVTVTLSRSILAMFVFCLIGLVLGTVAQIVVEEREKSREVEILKRHRDEPTESDATPAESASGEDTAAPVGA